MNDRESSPSVTIRRATEGDAEAVARLASDLGYPADEHAMRDRIRAVLASRADALIVADDPAGVAVGWLHAHAAQAVESGLRVEILGLVVSPAVRRGGVGRGLVAEAERWARGVGADTVVVRSNVTRTESHAFYPALGYRATKTQRVYGKSLRGDPAADPP